MEAASAASASPSVNTSRKSSGFPAPPEEGRCEVKRESLSPYDTFKSDRDRLWALISRDVRIVLVAAICVGAAGSAPAGVRAILAWFH